MVQSSKLVSSTRAEKESKMKYQIQQYTTNQIWANDFEVSNLANAYMYLQYYRSLGIPARVQLQSQTILVWHPVKSKAN